MHKDHTLCPACGAEAVVIASEKNVAWGCGSHVRPLADGITSYAWVCLEVKRLRSMQEEPLEV